LSQFIQILSNNNTKNTIMEGIDCHCHVFNITSVGLRALLEKILEAKTLIENNNKIDRTTDSSDKVKRSLSDLIELAKIFCGDSETILSMLDKHYNRKFKLLPLMFDGDFLLDGASDEEKTHIKNAVQMVHDHLNIHYKTVQSPQNSHRNLIDALNEIMQKMEDDIDQKMRDGFTVQYDDLVAIKKNKKYSNKVFPFLGIDPRRNNIDTLIQQVGKNKTFAGIKLYPPNGFSPSDPRLDNMYNYCSQNNIPIIVHCSYGGFATPVKTLQVNGYILKKGESIPVEYNGEITFEKGLLIDTYSEMVRERARLLNHPRIWGKVLEKHPRLKLVLAHFGDSDDKNCLDEWRNEIKILMTQYPSLYTDISCMSDADCTHLNKVKTIYDTNPALQGRILYGSDYFLDMFFNSSFDEYLNRIKGVFKTKSFNQISKVNTENFVNSWYKSVSVLENVKK